MGCPHRCDYPQWCARHVHCTHHTGRIALRTGGQSGRSCLRNHRRSISPLPRVRTNRQPAGGRLFELQRLASSCPGRNVGSLDSQHVSYTYSHSIDDSSDRSDGSYVDSYNPQLPLVPAPTSISVMHLLSASCVGHSVPQEAGLNSYSAGWVAILRHRLPSPPELRSA